MKKNKIYIGFDGVILDTDETARRISKYFSFVPWSDLCKDLNWDEFLNDSRKIKDNLSIIKELQNMKREIYIVTAMNYLHQATAKIKYLRDRCINAPVLFIPPEIVITQLHAPKNDEVLIDSSKLNVDAWDRMGGYGMLFSEQFEGNMEKEVNDLTFLLK